MRIRPFQPGDQQGVIELWKRCGLVVPWNDPGRDIERKLRAGADLFLVGERKGRLTASAMGGYEGHRGWVNYLAVDPEYRGRGDAREIMQVLESRLLELGCPKINLQVRETNVDVIRVYEALGYKRDPVVSLGKRLIED